MKKNEYETPKVIEHGDIKKITLAGGTQSDAVDATWTTYDPNGIPTGHVTWGS